MENLKKYYWRFASFDSPFQKFPDVWASRQMARLRIDWYIKGMSDMLSARLGSLITIDKVDND